MEKGPQVGFTVRGHLNIRATHPSTIEFTKDERLSLKGNCIIGVEASFTEGDIQRFIRRAFEAGGSGQMRLVKISIELFLNYSTEPRERITAVLNPGFSHPKEMVIRMGNFHSERTLGMRASKAAAHLDRGLVKELQNPAAKMWVVISSLGQ